MPGCIIRKCPMGMMIRDHRHLKLAVAEMWQHRNLLACCLYPLSLVYRSIMSTRRFCYQTGLARVHESPVPTIVIGNLSVGGTGKSPLVMAVAELLVSQNRRPGIIARGYGATDLKTTKIVWPGDTANTVGDEALMMSRRGTCPVVVCPDRVAARSRLLQQSDIDVVLSDDGLQHLALGRTCSISVVDGQRRWGNGFCLPAGPLREPVRQHLEADIRLARDQAEGDEFRFYIQPHHWVNVITPEQQRPLESFHRQTCHAVAAIGQPQRFFEMLHRLGIDFKPHPFPDHHDFDSRDLEFTDDQPILMTEKDAVKCQDFKLRNSWYLHVDAVIDEDFFRQLDNFL